MILVDREDVERIGHLGYWTYLPTNDVSEDTLPHPGPFLVRVNDEQVWMSRGDGDVWHFVVQRFRLPCLEQQQWSAYFDLYAEGIGISTATLRNRFMGMRRRLRGYEGVWFLWRNIYTWREGPDEVWDSLYEHPWLETRERDGYREVRYVK